MILDTYSAVEEYLQNNWTLSDIAWENTSLKPDESPITADAYIRVTHIPISTSNPELNGRNRFDSVMNVDCFEKNGKGKRRAAEMATRLAELFDINIDITSDEQRTIHFLVPVPQPGFDDGHGFFQLPVHCPWYCFYNP